MMAKKIGVAVLVVALLALAVSTVFAKVNEQQQKEIDALYQQIREAQKQIIQKYVEAGELTPEQGKAITDRIDYYGDYYKNNPGAYGPFSGGFGPGFGAGYGPGFCPGPCGRGGFGPGFYGPAGAPRF